MHKEMIKFGDNKIEKETFNCNKNPFFKGCTYL